MTGAVNPAEVFRAVFDQPNCFRYACPLAAIAFDTLNFAKTLTEAGFTEQQIEVLAAAKAAFQDRAEDPADPTSHTPTKIDFTFLVGKLPLALE